MSPKDQLGGVGVGWQDGGTLRYLESEDGECFPLSLLSNVFIFRNKDDTRITLSSQKVLSKVFLQSHGLLIKCTSSMLAPMIRIGSTESEGFVMVASGGQSV